MGISLRFTLLVILFFAIASGIHTLSTKKLWEKSAKIISRQKGEDVSNVGDREERKEKNNSATTSPVLKRVKVKKKKQPVVAGNLPNIFVPKKIVSPPLVTSTTAGSASSSVEIPTTSKQSEDTHKEELPPLDTDAIFRAVVKLECLSADGTLKYGGSGFALPGGRVVSAAHIIAVSGGDSCDIIFPHERRPVVYFHGTVAKAEETRKRYNKEGIDVMLLLLPALDASSEAKKYFSEYPTVPYSICSNPDMIGDTFLHFGYPANFLDQSYLQALQGEAAAYADIKGVEEKLSEDQRSTQRAPIFDFLEGSHGFHPYIVSIVPSFYGDSGGLAFDVTKQCIVGVDHGFGRAESGDTFSVIAVLGFEKAKEVLSY